MCMMTALPSARRSGPPLFVASHSLPAAPLAIHTCQILPLTPTPRDASICHLDISRACRSLPRAPQFALPGPSQVAEQPLPVQIAARLVPWLERSDRSHPGPGFRNWQRCSELDARSLREPSLRRRNVAFGRNRVGRDEEATRWRRPDAHSLLISSAPTPNPRRLAPLPILSHLHSLRTFSVRGDEPQLRVTSSPNRPQNSIGSDVARKEEAGWAPARPCRSRFWRRMGGSFPFHRVDCASYLLPLISAMTAASTMRARDVDVRDREGEGAGGAGPGWETRSEPG
ncbi:uncharacterized protein K452DRAFT_116677 [Aplosporella prunicola CBS 121167]|uniref:Uncharacterized protein n=1 Tax=Aplosporella prunicola CBS 121167 TaxID=1176127 RepID=A0A6A6B1J0_9PEZI|nr:uncharacterized protein K452DRAFT_116677 [Aplosporella prunicola CBS 121167]KAF2136887.1 hypothetical protein K452DRAFT_116677 [Aplosporella prunicola CBS 121167]